jgi:hypothetical protein
MAGRMLLLAHAARLAPPLARVTLSRAPLAQRIALSAPRPSASAALTLRASHRAPVRSSSSTSDGGASGGAPSGSPLPPSPPPPSPPPSGLLAKFRA